MDTRSAGRAPARIKEHYAACGRRLDPAELTDHPPVVAHRPAARGRRPIPARRPPIDLHGPALGDDPALPDPMAATLPPTHETRREATRMAANGVQGVGTRTAEVTAAIQRR